MPARRPTATWLTADGVTLEIEAPHPDHADLLAWWWPLHRAARWAWYVQAAWPIHLEEFQLVGRVPRSGRPDVWVYVHQVSGRELFVDGDGSTYHLRPLRSEPSRGRFFACHVRTAVVRAGLHEAPPAEPGRFDQEHGVQAWLTPFPPRVSVSPLPRRLDRRDPPGPPPPGGPVAELPLLGPFGESACPDPACTWCRDRAHDHNGWCEDPTCARCNGGTDLGPADPTWWEGLAAEPGSPVALPFDGDGAFDEVQAQRDRRQRRGAPPSETGS